MLLGIYGLPDTQPASSPHALRHTLIISRGEHICQDSHYRRAACDAGCAGAMPSLLCMRALRGVGHNILLHRSRALRRDIDAEMTRAQSAIIMIIIRYFGIRRCAMTGNYWAIW